MLTPPHPAPVGRARFAAARDTDTLVAFLHAFRDETEQTAEDIPGIVAFKLSRGEYVVWEVDGGIVSMAAVSATVAGAARIAPVYTPPHLRRRGYAAAVTAARAAATLKDGADTVLLFTDLANPTSNSVYQSIGFVPVEDRVIVGFPAHEDEEIPR
ncbi:MAG: GNAT family N-acetyltransferase [Streptomycetaceae bacterium]|nr:GNAT family N-acetyltransferase [Streptomycetaceae bacterium]